MDQVFDFIVRQGQTKGHIGLFQCSAATAQLFNAMVGSGLGEEDSVAALKLLESLSGD